jgi:hypothetical protein
MVVSMRLLRMLTSWSLNSEDSWLVDRSLNPWRLAKGPWRNGKSGRTFSREEGAQAMAETDRERGKPASFDPKSGEVHGSGSGAGGGGNPDEDYDQDPIAGGGAEPPHGPGARDEGK